MKNIIRITIALLIAFLLLAIQAIGSPNFFTKQESHKIKIQPEDLESHVKALTKTTNYRNYSNITSLNEAAHYVKTQFELLNLPVQEQSYKVGNETYKNIISYYGPKDGKRIIIGAHYDVCGDQDGADDNASGIAGLIEIAKQFQKYKPTTKYRFEFVAYTLEEPPFFRTEHMGSHVHAKSLHDNNVAVSAMISLEMIGYFSEAPKSQEYPIGILKWFYPTKANYIAVVGKFGSGKLTRKFKKGIKKGSTIPVRSINAPSSITGIDFSDHLNYWKFNYDAIMITDTSFFRNKNYHQTSDTIETLDFDKMSQVVKGVTYTLFNYD